MIPANIIPNTLLFMLLSPFLIVRIQHNFLVSIELFIGFDYNDCNDLFQLIDFYIIS